MLGHDLVVNCIDCHLFANPVGLIAIYDRTGKSVVITSIGRLACLVDHLDSLGYYWLHSMLRVPN
jgi:hypothetical protein